ncbi:hypothetical protein [Novosphingobium sp. Gsoil 351]|nr:hypothetical protein [Novosphingobium sp. Gsoil 351]QGN55766.1 hypothetical protein GKE62_15625 [Novosphingobium sp. Gsoil 351]
MTEPETRTVVVKDGGGLELVRRPGQQFERNATRLCKLPARGDPESLDAN